MKRFVRPSILLVFTLYSQPVTSSPDQHSFEADIFDMMQKTNFFGPVEVTNSTDGEVCLEVLERLDGKLPRKPTILDGPKDNSIIRFTDTVSETKAVEKSIPSGGSLLLKNVSARNNRIRFKSKDGCPLVCLNFTSIDAKSCKLSLDSVQRVVFPLPCAQFNFMPKRFQSLELLAAWAQKDLAQFDSYENITDPAQVTKFQKDFDNALIYVASTMTYHEKLGDSKAIFKRRQELFDLYNPSLLLGGLQLPLKASDVRIPLITHTIWLTDRLNPTQFPVEFANYLLESVAVMPAAEGWVHNLWILNSAFMQGTIAGLAGTGIQVRELYADAECTQLTGCGEFPYRKMFEDALGAKKYGMASDIARLVILLNEGGIYKDTDYRFGQSPIVLNCLYDSYYGLEPQSVYLGNALMAAKPNHPITRKALELIDRNSDPSRKPGYLKECDGEMAWKTIIISGPGLTTLAHHLAAGTEGNRDIVLPHFIVYPLQGDKSYPGEMIITPTDPMAPTNMGEHFWRSSWLPTEVNKQFGSKG